MGKQAEKTKKSIICYKYNVIMKDQVNKIKNKKNITINSLSCTV